MIKYYGDLPNGINFAYDRKSQSYLADISCALDTETTNYIIDEEHRYSWIYIFQLMIDTTFITCRTFDELEKIFKTISNKYGLNEKRRMVIYVHNLSFEFQFLRTHFHFVDCLTRQNRNVFKVFFDEFGLEFRDSLILSGMSLAKTAENLTEHTIKKLKGDLDYNLIRLPCTPITPEELKYCYNDVKIICCYIDEQRKIYGNIAKIPLTNTGRVRKFVRDNCFHTVKNPKTGKKSIPYKNLTEKLTIEPVEYGYAKMAFLGGYTHANAKFSCKILSDVHSIDFTSSYPTVMVSEKYPMSKGAFIKLDMWNYEEYKKFLSLGDRVATVMVEMWNIETKENIPDDYISSSRCFKLTGEQTNNGRVHKAKYIQSIFTSVDIEEIISAYDIEKIHFIDGYFYYTDYLPKEIIESVLELYQKKTTLKGVKGKETEYLLNKGMLNSCYGMCVTDIVSDIEQCTFEDGWQKEKANIEESIEKYNNDPHRFLSYIWGIFVTAYARKNLFEGIKSIGEDYIYCDTDSIKFFNKEKHDDYINRYNKKVTEKCEECLKNYDLDISLLSPLTKTGKKKPIGIWDYEGKYKFFKTLGCKRYLTYTDEDKFSLTCAGLPEKQGIEELTRETDDIKKVFEKFNDEFRVDENNSGKLAHLYVDTPFCIEKVIDYLGNSAKINCKSAVVLFPIPFTINFSSDYAIFLKYIIGGIEK